MQYTLKQFHDASATSCAVFSSIRIEYLYEWFRQRDLNLSCRWMRTLSKLPTLVTVLMDLRECQETDPYESDPNLNFRHIP